MDADGLFSKQESWDSLTEWLQRVASRAAQLRPEADLPRLMEISRLRVTDVVSNLKAIVSRERSKDGPSDSESAQTRAAMLHTQLVETIARWEQKLTTCVRTNTCCVARAEVAGE